MLGVFIFDALDPLVDLGFSGGAFLARSRRCWLISPAAGSFRWLDLRSSTMSCA